MEGLLLGLAFGWLLHDVILPAWAARHTRGR